VSNQPYQASTDPKLKFFELFK